MVAKQPKGFDRGLLTKRDREIISGEGEFYDAAYYSSINRLRKKIEELEHDVALIEEHESHLVPELRAAVCPDQGE